MLAIALGIAALSSGPKNLERVLSYNLQQQPWEVSFSGDGRSLAVVGECGVVLFDSVGWRPTRVEHLVGASKLAALGRNSFAFDSAFTFSIVTPGSALRSFQNPQDEYIYGLASKGTVLALSLSRNTFLFDTVRGVVFRSIRHGNEFGAPIVSAWEGFAGGPGQAQYIPTDASKPHVNLHLPEGYSGRFAFAKRAGRLVVGVPDGRIFIYRSPAAIPELLARPLRAFPYGVSVTPDGKLIALGYKTNLQGRIPNERNLLALLDGQTGKVLQRVRLPDGVQDLAFNSSGTLLAEVNRSGRLEIFSVARAR